MATKFENDAALETKFERTIKAILGNFLIYKDKMQDLERATDFTIMRAHPFGIAIRFRRHKYIKYADEFTIRYSRPSGVMTEIHKIEKGYADFMLYGFINQDESKIIKYFIGDLAVFRKVNSKPYRVQDNLDGTQFAIYKLGQFPKEFVKKNFES